LSAGASQPRPALLLAGPTGAGKTPLGEELERRGFLGRPCLHFDFGANLRAAAGDGAGEHGLTSEEQAAVHASLATGALFEARDIPLIVKILSRFLESLRPGPGTLLVLNGLPRHRDQAEALAAVVAVERVIWLEADAAVIRERLRRDPGSDRSGRIDDDEAAVARRLAIFRERTAPLLDFYRDRGVPITAIAVTASMTAAAMYDEVARLLRQA
jgi:adenylate kinase